MGKYQARQCADVIMGRDAGDGIVPRVTFTDPQACAVGLTEAQARTAGHPVKVVSVTTGSVAGAYVQGKGIDGRCALVVDEPRRVLLGASSPDRASRSCCTRRRWPSQGGWPRRPAQDAGRWRTAPGGRMEWPAPPWHSVPSFPTFSEAWLRLLEAYGL